MKPRKPFLLRISPTLYDSIEAWAQQEMRSVNGQIEYILKEAICKRNRSYSDESDEPGPPSGPEHSHDDATGETF